MSDLLISEEWNKVFTYRYIHMISKYNMVVKHLKAMSWEINEIGTPWYI